MSLGIGILSSAYKAAAPSGIVTTGLVLNLDPNIMNSYADTRSFVTAKIYSVTTTLRSAAYSVQWSDNNSTWTTEFSGVMSNNSATGLQTGTILFSNPTSAHRYWRYVEGTAVIAHHPVCSRIILTTSTGEDITFRKYEDDNTSSVGQFAIGSVTRDYKNTINDLSNNSYVLNLINGPVYNPANGGYIVYDGTNDYGAFVQKQSFMNQNFSISLWVNPSSQIQALTSIIDDSHGGNQGWVIQSENATSNRNYYLAYFNGSTYEPVGNIGSGKGVQLTNSVWQNITYVKNGTSVIGYKNGIAQVNYTATNSNVRYVNNLDVSLGGILGSRSFNSSISQVLVYGVGLSSSDVLQNFNAVKSRYGL